MTFETTKLHPSLIQDLYRHFLLDETPLSPVLTANDTGLTYVGKNKKNVLVVVEGSKNEIIGKEDLAFLTSILASCSLEIEDVAVVNKGFGSIDLQKVIEELKPLKILVFGSNTEQLNIPLEFPNFQVQKYNNKVYLTAPPLIEITDAKPLKKLLWESLQKIFL